jgi:hypothetical protein
MESRNRLADAAPTGVLRAVVNKKTVGRVVARLRSPAVRYVCDCRECSCIAVVSSVGESCLKCFSSAHRGGWNEEFKKLHGKDFQLD